MLINRVFLKLLKDVPGQADSDQILSITVIIVNSGIILVINTILANFHILSALVCVYILRYTD